MFSEPTSFITVTSGVAPGCVSMWRFSVVMASDSNEPSCAEYERHVTPAPDAAQARWYCRPSGLFGDDRVGFDLDEHLGLKQPGDDDHARRRADRAEEFAVGARDVFAEGDVGDVGARADHVGELRAGLRERGFDVADGLESLRVGIAFADELSVGIPCHGAGDAHVRADAHRARKSNDRLPRRAG